MDFVSKVAQGDLAEARGSFKERLNNAIFEELESVQFGIQSELAEAHPNLFDSPKDEVIAASYMPDMVDDANGNGDDVFAATDMEEDSTVPKQSDDMYENLDVPAKPAAVAGNTDPAEGETPAEADAHADNPDGEDEGIEEDEQDAGKMIAAQVSDTIKQALRPRNYEVEASLNSDRKG